jgi:hypothetical protein
METMNEELLIQFRKTPRTEFADALYKRISRKSQPHFPWKMVNKLTFRNAGVMFILLFLVAACVYAVVEKRWNKIGEIWVNVQNDPKVPLVIIGNFEKGPAGDDEAANLAEARSALNFEFSFPSWAPTGFALGNTINISPWSEKNLSAFWESENGGTPIGIYIDYRWFEVAGANNPMYESVATLPVAPGSYEEVDVQGQPAVLVHGDWNWNMGEPGATPETTLGWNENNGLSLYWIESDVAYLLWTYNPDVSAKDLITMAESAQ